MRRYILLFLTAWLLTASPCWASSLSAGDPMLKGAADADDIGDGATNAIVTKTQESNWDALKTALDAITGIIACDGAGSYSAATGTTGTAAQAGSDVVTTSGSSTTVTVPVADHGSMQVGTTLVANGATRYVVSVSASPNVVVNAAVNWDNGGLGYSYTYQDRNFAFPATGTLALVVCGNGSILYFNSSGTVTGIYDAVTGNVGIGNATPDVKLEVNSGSQNGIVIGAESSNPFGANFAGLDILISTVRGQFVTDEGSKAVVVKATTNHPLVFYANDDEKMRINTDGNVGIGTTDLDGTPAVGRRVAKASTNDGSTLADVLRDSDEVNVWEVDSDGELELGIIDSKKANVTVKGYGYIQLCGTQMEGAGLSATKDTTATNETYGQVLFDNATDKATNWTEWRIKVPRDIDTSVELYAWFDFRLAGADTGDHEYEISMDTVDASGDYTGTPGTAVSLAYTADASGADGDREVASGELTGWGAAMAGTAGQEWVIRMARDGDHANDSSTTDSYSGTLEIRYGKSQ